MNPVAERITGQARARASISRIQLSGLVAFVTSLFVMVAMAPQAGAQAKGVEHDVAFQGARDYIVLYKRSVDLDSRLAAEARKGNDVEDRYESAVNGALLELEADDVNRLRQDDRVFAIEPNRPVSIASQAQGTRNAASWGLDRVDQRNLPLNGNISTAREGAGVEAYVIDTGIRLDHTQFSGRVNPEGFSAFSGGWNDCHGHGTHVAGTVAGSTYGVAPAARVTAVRVLDCDGSGSNASVIGGIDWVVSDHQAGQPAVANMSLGGGRSDTLNAAVQRAVDDGVSMVVAAGNETSDACGRSPASAPNAVTVGSTTNADQVSSFSNHGRCVDIFGPGSNIISAWHTSATATYTASGTSMAAPHVAGIASLILSGQPSLSPSAVTDRLVASATPGRLSGINGCTKNLLSYAGSEADLPAPPDGPGGPGNDNFANRQALSNLSGVNGTSACATHEAGEPSHGSGSSASIWYSWTAPQDGTLTLRTQGSSYDTLLAAYSGSSVGSLTQRAQNDDSGGNLWSQVSFQVSSGTTYSIAIDGWGGASGNTVLSGSFSSGGGDDPGDPGDPGNPDPARPVNDNFADRSLLSSLGGISAASAGATGETGEPRHYGSQDPRSSVWWRWTAPSDGVLQLDTSGSTYDTIMAVYRGSSLGSLEQVASDDDSGDGLTSRVSLRVSSGVTYSIAVDGYSGASGGIRLAGSHGQGGQPGDPGSGIGSGSVSDLRQNSSSEWLYDFEISATATSNVCDDGFCGWFPIAFAYPAGTQCSSTGEGGSRAWVGDYTDQPGTQRSSEDVHMFEDPPFRFCIYIYSYVDDEADYRLVHDEILAPEDFGSGPGDPPDEGGSGPDDPPDEGSPAWLPRPRINSGPARKTQSRIARFTFSGRGDTYFQCRLGDRRYWTACGSPKRYRGLKPGRHTLRVRQTDGQTESQAATYSWRIAKKKK